MTPILDFFCEGVPAPGGSKNFFPTWRKDGSLVTVDRNGRAWPVIRVVDDAGARNKQWRDTVSWQAKAATPRDWQPIDAEKSIECRFNFWLPRPAGHLTSKGAPSSQWRRFPTVRPDVLKLARSTEDALTGIVWVDDAQVVSQINTKEYAERGQRVGCRVRITIL